MRRSNGKRLALKALSQIITEQAPLSVIGRVFDVINQINMRAIKEKLFTPHTVKRPVEHSRTKFMQALYGANDDVGDGLREHSMEMGSPTSNKLIAQGRAIASPLVSDSSNQHDDVIPSMPNLDDVPIERASDIDVSRLEPDISRVEIDLEGSMMDVSAIDKTESADSSKLDRSGIEGEQSFADADESSGELDSEVERYTITGHDDVSIASNSNSMPPVTPGAAVVQRPSNTPVSINATKSVMTSAGYYVLTQSDVFVDVFLGLEERQEVSPQYLMFILVEYLRTLNFYRISVDYNLCELVVGMY